ncbi:MAG: hypothetical protein AAF974_06785 [Cyanobacteria bacterium P01_E01_bin.34]
MVNSSKNTGNSKEKKLDMHSDSPFNRVPKDIECAEPSERASQISDIYLEDNCRDTASLEPEQLSEQLLQ